MERIAPGIWKMHLGDPEVFTPTSMREHEIQLDALKQLGDPSETPFTEDQIVFKLTMRGCVIEIPLHTKEQLYGFGLQLKSFNQTQKKKHLRVNADPVADTGDTHAPVPFYASTAGYGVFVDSARYVTFNCGNNSKLLSTTAADEVRTTEIQNNTEALYAERSFSVQQNVVIEIPYTKGVDIYFFAGLDIKTVVQRYNLFSGGGCLPPYWGLGIWYRTCGRFSEDQVLRQAKAFREDKMPIDVLGLEPGWQSHSYSCSYSWDPVRFKNHEDFLEKVRAMDFKLNLWEHVFIHPTSPIYNQLKQYSGNYEVWGGLVPDLALQEARDIFGTYHREALINKGILGFKLDECDGSDYTRGWSYPNCAEFPSGLDGELMHCLIGNMYQNTIFSEYRANNTRTYNSVRASHALASPLPFVLYSDLYDHRDFIRGVVNMGFSGLLWSPEVRQCDSVEDLLRRLQTVIFSPQALINAWMIPNAPWLQYDGEKNERNEYIENHKEITDMVRKLFELRMQLIPYLYTSFAAYHFYGLPPFRALVMDYPEDENTYSVDNEYLMGDSILVAPVVAGENDREVYLPAGNWVCFWTNQKFTGGQHYSINVPIDRIPVFVKEGTLLPLAKPVQHIDQNTIFEITLQCYGECDASTVLYEDDGLSFDFEKGVFNTVTLNYSENHLDVEKKGNYHGKKYSIIGVEKVS